MKNITAIILAAGEGTRMKSSLPKVLHSICGKPMINHLLRTLDDIGIRKVVAVVGYKADLVKKSLPEVKCVVQDKLLGTGDAVLKTKKTVLKEKSVDTILVTCGDVPLLTQATLNKLINKHISTDAACTLLTATLKNPTGYGRIQRSTKDKITKIIEEVDTSIYEKVIEEINVGVYCFDKSLLFKVLEKIKPANKKKEYYLTDVIEILAKEGSFISSVSTDDPEEFIGVNSRKDLIKAEQVVRTRILDDIMTRGVTVMDPTNTYIEEGVLIEKDTIIYPYTFIEKDVKIGSGCAIGPFARLREGTIIKNNVGIGNFAELVRTTVGDKTKIKHKCYIGDTVIGKSVNIGAGTIVANYDGKVKHKTFIEDNAFIGTGTILIAPVKIGRGAVTGAGSVVTKEKNVPPGKTVIGIPAKILKKNKRSRNE